MKRRDGDRKRGLPPCRAALHARDGQVLARPRDPVLSSEALLDLLEGRTSLRELDGITDEELAGAYASAATHFADRDFGQALESFAWLVAMEPREPSYWLALGLTEQALGEDLKAARSFSAAAMLDPENPAPHLFAAESLLRDGQMSLAREAALAALELAGDRPDQAALALGAGMLLERLPRGVHH